MTTVKQLIERLVQFPMDMQIVLSNDGEGNEYKYIDSLCAMEFQKTNNNGSFDALVLFPSDTILEPYDEEEVTIN